MVLHLSKAKSGKAIFRGQGSIDFTAAARSVLLVGSDPDEPESRGIIQIKCNLARLGDSVGFSLAEGRFAWSNGCTLTAGQVLGEETTAEGRCAQEEAKAFLRAMLADGPKLARDIYKEAQKESVCSERTLKTVKSRLGISSEKRADGWYWVPSGNDQGGKGARVAAWSCRSGFSWFHQGNLRSEGCCTLPSTGQGGRMLVTRSNQERDYEGGKGTDIDKRSAQDGYIGTPEPSGVPGG